MLFVNAEQSVVFRVAVLPYWFKQTLVLSGRDCKAGNSSKHHIESCTLAKSVFVAIKTLPQLIFRKSEFDKIGEKMCSICTDLC